MEEVRADYVIDKSAWGDGPWQEEPDRAEFTHAGFACVAVRHGEDGHWCGYVGVPRSHPAYGKDADEVNVRFHGELNYAAPCDGGRVCHVPQPGMPEDVWWLGGHFAHIGDLSPGAEAGMRELGIFRRGVYRAVYRDLKYVRASIKLLADQLKAMQLAKTRRLAGQL